MFIRLKILKNLTKELQEEGEGGRGGEVATVIENMRNKIE